MAEDNEIIEDTDISFIYGQLYQLQGRAQGAKDNGNYMDASYVIDTINEVLPCIRSIRSDDDNQLKNIFLLMSTLQRVFIDFHEENPDLAEKHLKIIEKIFSDFISNIFGEEAEKELLEIQEAQVFNHPLDGVEI